MRKTDWLLVGGDTILGREIRDLVEEQDLPVRLHLASSRPDEHIVSAPEGEDDDLEVMHPLDRTLVETADVLLLCGGREVNERAAALARESTNRPAVVDLTGQFEELPESRLRAPLLEAGEAATGEAIHTLAHPAAVALARVLVLLHARYAVERTVATILEPVSQQGRAGIDELHNQTLSLLNFREAPRDVFDAQVSFNLLPRYGSAAPHALGEAAARIERHLATLLGARRVPLASVRLIQAPVFHGYCMTVWVEFTKRPPVAALEHLLEEAGIDVRRGGAEPASNVSVAGQVGLTVSDIAEDHAAPQAVWLWLAFDNLRAHAEAALLTAGLLARGRESK
ncbi:MAG: Asd/ArgC dimerization domain-containing protein [Bryobacteraceae bacterium]